MTGQQAFYAQALSLIAVTMEIEMVFQSTPEQAWNVFQEALVQHPAVLSAHDVRFYASSFQRELPLMWPAYQYELARSFGVL